MRIFAAHLNQLKNMNQHQIFIAIGAILGALSVGIGAFGAHGLKNLLIEHGRMETFETAVKYQFYHTLAILFVGMWMQQHADKQLVWAGVMFMVGIFIFSGSLYVLCLTNIKWLGAITPIGGVAFIAGWVLVFLSALKN